jgi:hypothetical protein
MSVEIREYECHTYEIRNKEEIRWFFVYAKRFLEKATKEGKKIFITIGCKVFLVSDLKTLEGIRSEMLKAFENFPFKGKTIYGRITFVKFS